METRAVHTILAYAPREKGSPLTPLVAALTASGFAVARAALDSGEADASQTLRSLFAGRPPDVVLGDLSASPDCLPLRHLRRLLARTWDAEGAVPCLALLTPRHLSLPDWPACADDFLLPPYAPSEAAARIRLLLFRCRQVGMNDTLRLADVTLNLAGGTAHDAHNNPLPLTPREYDLLCFLAMHRGKFFTRERLLDLVWGVQFEGGERTVDIHVRRLRAKLPAQASARLQTRRGTGYGMAGD